MADITQAFAAAVERHNAGDLANAEVRYRAILTTLPDHTATLCNLGVLLAGQNRNAEAAQCYTLCLASNPGYADAHYNLGNLYRRLERWADAVCEYQSCLRCNPAHNGAHFNLGLALSNLGDLTAAADCFRRVIATEPNHADAFNRLGDIFMRAGQPELGLDAFRRSAELKPEDHRVWNNYGLALLNVGQATEAEGMLRKSIALKSDYPDAYNTLGLAYEQLGRKDDASDAYRRALEIKPEYADAWSNLGTNLTEAGRADEAIDALRKAVTLRPNAAAIHSNLLLTLNYSSHITPAQVLEEHRLWAAKHVSGHPPATQPLEYSVDRVLRKGYVSADFRTHTVAGFIQSLLIYHDRKHFHVTAYANLPRPDETTERMKKQADAFRTIVGLSDAAAADLIREDGIDILVDLSGHTAGNRLELFGLRPAPIQMTLFGYPNTTGLNAMDYRITDEIADPPGMTETLYVEKLLRVEGLAWVYQPPNDAPMVSELPALVQPSLTFGCLNNPAKISDLCLETWAKLLAAIPDSRLVVLAGLSRRGADRLRERFFDAGVSTDRLELLFRLPAKEYFEAYLRMDLTLDPFPYNGGVTTCDSLWMGVPVLAVAGNSYVSRQGASIMTHVGNSEFVAESPAHLIELAKTWACNKEWLADVRGGLRRQMARSPVADGVRYVKALEKAYHTAWQARV